MLACHGLDPLDCREYAQLLPACPDSEVLLLHIPCRIALADQACNLEITETKYFSLPEHILREGIYVVIFLEDGHIVDDVLELSEEPAVDFGEFKDPVYAVAFLEGLSDGEYAEVGRVLEFVVEVVEVGVVIAYEAVHALAYHPESLLDKFFEGASDAHDFPD